MKAKFFAGIFFFVFLLAAARNVAVQAQTALTEEQQTALIIQSAKKIKELKDKATVAGAITGLTRDDVKGLIREGTVQLNGPAHRALKATGENNRKGIEGLRQHTAELGMKQQTDLAARILIVKGIKNPTDNQYAEALAEAKKIGDIANPLDRTKALFKALSPATDADVQQAKVDAEKAVQTANDAKAKVDQANATALMASRDALDAKATAKAADEKAGQAKADAAMAKQIAGDAKTAADDAKKSGEEVADKVDDLQGEVEQTKALSEVTARTVVEVVKEDEKVLVKFFYNVSEAGLNLHRHFRLTLVDVQRKKGFRGNEPDSVEEFQKWLSERFQDQFKLAPEEARRKAEDLTAGMTEE